MRVGTTIENVYETYTAAEAEYAVGIPVAMQRDWRRRGYLPPIEEGRKARYEGSEVARMAILKAVSDAGAYLHSAVVAADIGAPVILDILYAATLERARYRGPGPIQGCWEKTPRWLLIQDEKVSRTASLDAAAGAVNDPATAEVTIVIDLTVLALKLLDRLPRPAMTVKITEPPEAE